jgi:hypothetical protein
MHGNFTRIESPLGWRKRVERAVKKLSANWLERAMLLALWRAGRIEIAWAFESCTAMMTLLD